MKKQLTVALGLAVLATPAFASKARLQALGEDVNGSFYINDNRNIFLNAAEINNNKDLVTFEWGTAKTTDSDTAPNAEGGFIKNWNNLVYGVHFGRVSDFNSGVGTSFNTATTTSTFNASNNIDLFVGGDAGMKWGANVSYATGENDTFQAGPLAADTVEAESRTLDVNVGVQAGDIGAYVRAGIMGKVEHNDAQGAALEAEVERKTDIEVGATFKLNDYTIYGQYLTQKFEADEDGTDDDIKNTNYLIGVGRSDKMTDKTALFTKLEYSNTKFDQDSADDAEKTSRVPVTIGLEHEATSWLALRASVSQNLWSKEDDGDKRTIANSTNVNAGAGLKFGDLMIDGVIGTSTNGTVVADNAENGALSLDNVMTRVSMTYRF